VSFHRITKYHFSSLSMLLKLFLVYCFCFWFVRCDIPIECCHLTHQAYLRHASQSYRLYATHEMSRRDMEYNMQLYFMYLFELEYVLLMY
jgi:hypothetical protein